MPRRISLTMQLLQVIVVLVCFMCVPSYGQEFKSERGGEQLTIEFQNATQATAYIYWIDFAGREQFQGELKPGKTAHHKTLGNFAWRVKVLGKNFLDLRAKQIKFLGRIDISFKSRAIDSRGAFVKFTGDGSLINVFYVGRTGEKFIGVLTEDQATSEIDSIASIGDLYIFRRSDEQVPFDWYLVGNEDQQTYQARPASFVHPGRVQPPPDLLAGADPGPVQPPPDRAVGFKEDFYGGGSSLGRGFNMFAANKNLETRVPLVLFDPQSTPRQIYGQTIEVPGNVNHNPFPDSAFSSELNASYNALEVQDKLQTSLGIEGGFRGVTASVEATYGRESVQKEGTTFVEYKVQIRPATFSFRPESPIVLAPAFQQALERFRDANVAADRAVQDQFFTTYGTHYVQQVSLGAACTMVARLSHSANLDKEEIGLAAKVSFDAKIASAGVKSDIQLETLRSRFESKSKITFTAVGGDANIIVTGGENGNINRAAYSNWIDSTKTPGKLSDVERHVKPIWQLSQDPAIRTNLRKALDDFSARNKIDLDSTAFNKQVMGYKVTLTLERIQVKDDNDTGADQGDLFWHLWLERPDGIGASQPRRVTLSEVVRDSYINIGSGGTRFFRDMVTDKGALEQTFEVPVGGRFKIGGRAGDVDGGLLGEDDIFGESESVIRAPTNRDPKRATNTLPHEEILRFNRMGDVIIFFTVKYTPIL